MKIKRTTYQQDLIERLKNPRYALGYLNACLEERDEETFFLALRDVAVAHGGLRRLAQKTKLNREHLFRMLSKHGNPRWQSVRSLVESFGWKIAFVQKSRPKLLHAA
jgi:probable addiction module antidote protein